MKILTLILVARVLSGVKMTYFGVFVEGGCMRMVQKIVWQTIKGMTVLAQNVWTFLLPKLYQVYFTTIKTAFFNSTSNSKFHVNVGVSEFTLHACPVMPQCCCFHFSLAFINSPSKFCVNVGHGFRVHMSHGLYSVMF